MILPVSLSSYHFVDDRPQLVYLALHNISSLKDRTDLLEQHFILFNLFLFSLCFIKMLWTVLMCNRTLKIKLVCMQQHAHTPPPSFRSLTEKSPWERRAVFWTHPHQEGCLSGTRLQELMSQTWKKENKAKLRYITRLGYYTVRQLFDELLVVLVFFCMYSSVL